MPQNPPDRPGLPHQPPTPSPGRPLRVVSLLPSATEIVAGLAAMNPGRVELVGVSHECDYPPEVRTLPVLTSAKTAYSGDSGAVDRAVREALKPPPADPKNIENPSAEASATPSLYHLDAHRLRELAPDVIVTQDLCRVCSIDLGTVRAVAGSLDLPARVISLNPETLEGVFDDILSVGRALGLEAEAQRWLVSLRERMYAASDHVNPYADGPVVVFFEWTDPLFVGGHWTPQLIERAGGRHPLNATRALREAGAGAGPTGSTLRIAGKSVTVPREVVSAVQPGVVIVSPCGLTLEQAWLETEKLGREGWFAGLPACVEMEKGLVAVVDGNQMFNRPGPRLVDAFEFLVGVLNGVPGLIPRGFPWRRWRKGG